jgi:hypothetical protein
VRIAYIARWDIGAETGILKKMAGQMRAWQAAGHEVRFFALTPGHGVWEGLEDLDVVPFFGDNLRTRLTWRSRVSKPILDWRPDVVYLRFSTHYPALECVVEQVPTVAEINSDDVSEYPLVYPRHLYIAHRLTRSRLLSRTRGLVYVTHELARNPHNRRLGKRGFVLGNGVDVSRYPSLPAAGGQVPRLVFVGTAGCPWHGVDKVVELARANPMWWFDVVGYRRSEVAPGAPPNLTCHGHLTQDGYREIIAAADVAISTMALHRNSMDEASPLKTREYLACGIPTIIGYDDTDFPAGHPLILRLPNIADNVVNGMEQIRGFVGYARGKRISRADIAHLDVRTKEEQRLEFLQQITEQVRSHR